MIGSRSDVRRSTTRPVVGAVEAGLAGAAAGLQPGDEIVGHRRPAPCKTWEEAQFAIALRPGAELRLRLERDGQERERAVRADVAQGSRSGDGPALALSPLVRVGRWSPGAPAEPAGLRTDDGILQADATQVRSFADIQTAIAAVAWPAPGAAGLPRTAAVLDVPVTPRDAGAGPKLGIGNKVHDPKFGFVGAVRESVLWTWPT